MIMFYMNVGCAKKFSVIAFKVSGKKKKKKTENIYREKLQILRLFCSRLTEVFLECVRSKNSKKLQNVLIMLSCVEFRAFLRDLNSTNVAPFVADSLR